MKYLNAASYLIASLIVIACTIIPVQQQPIEQTGLWPDCATGQGNINNASLVIAPDSVDLDLFAGSLVGAFTEDGDCIGITYFSGTSNQNMVIRGAEPTSPDPRGAEVGESFELRVLNEMTPNVTATIPLVYAHDELYVLRSAGMPLSGDASEQINQLQQEVDDLQTQVNNLTDERNTAIAERNALQDDVDALTAERDALQTQLADEQATNTALTSQIDQAVSILTGGS